MVIRTTHGDIDESQLARTVGFEDRPSQFVVWVEWRLDEVLVRRDAFPLMKEIGPEIVTTLGPVDMATLVRTIEISEVGNEISVGVCWRLHDVLVRRDVHVILKQSSAMADALAASLA